MSDDAAPVIEDWVGRTQTRSDVVTESAAAALSALLDHERPLAADGQPLPPCWHWMLFNDTEPASGLDVDGHPQRGGFLPPVELPRRMWAGSRLRFHAPALVGDRLRRESVISSVQRKTGASGELVFVRVDHRVSRGDELLIEDCQDIVYRRAEKTAVTAAQPHVQAAQWTRELHPDPVLLFRYSALTFNGHRIHYDRDYAMHEEGYPGLVVQGPLTATLLLDLLARHLPDASVQAFEFRGLRPLFDTEVLLLKGARDGAGVSLWALDGRGALAMQADAQLA